jgi:hypothetical protein
LPIILFVGVPPHTFLPEAGEPVRKLVLADMIIQDLENEGQTESKAMIVIIVQYSKVFHI